MANYNAGSGQWEDGRGGSFDTEMRAQQSESAYKKRGGGFEDAVASVGGSALTLYALLGIGVYVLITFFAIVIDVVVFWLISIPIFKLFKKRNMSEKNLKIAKLIRWLCVAALLIYGFYDWYYSKPANQTFTPLVSVVELQKETSLNNKKETIKTLAVGEKVKILNVRGNGTECKVETADGTVGFISPDAFDASMNIVPTPSTSAIWRAISWQFTDPQVTLFQKGKYRTAKSNFEFEIAKHHLDKSGTGSGYIKSWKDPKKRTDWDYNIKMKISKNEVPVELNGVMYNYSVIFMEAERNADGSTVTGKGNTFVYIPIAEGILAGEFIATSNGSITSRDGKMVWKLEKEAN